MKDKHINIAADNALLKQIYSEVNDQLNTGKKSFARHITFKFVFYFSLTALSYLALYRAQSPVLFIFCFIAFGLVSLLFAFNFSHDFSHDTIFKSKKLNNLGFVLIYTMVGAHAQAWKQRHIHSHHFAPNVEEYDSDLKISKLIRVIPNSNHSWFHRFQHIYAPLAYMSYSLFWVFIKDFVILFSGDESRAKKNATYHLFFWIQKIFYIGYLLVLPACLGLQSWPVVVAGFILMHLLQSLFLLFTFFMTHHVEATAYPCTDKNGYINCSWLMNQIKSSNDMHPFSVSANFILGGFNNHIAHHLFPHIHHIYYPQLNKILYGILVRNGIEPNQTSYWGGAISHLKLLKKMSVRETSPTEQRRAA